MSYCLVRRTPCSLTPDVLFAMYRSLISFSTSQFICSLPSSVWFVSDNSAVAGISDGSERHPDVYPGVPVFWEFYVAHQHGRRTPLDVGTSLAAKFHRTSLIRWLSCSCSAAFLKFLRYNWSLFPDTVRPLYIRACVCYRFLARVIWGWVFFLSIPTFMS